jgi:hypothetical protein
MKKWRRIVLITLSVIAAIIILVFAFLSPIAKWAIEKYSPKYTGRQIKMDGLFLNLFNGNFTAQGFKIYEKDGKTVFFYADKLYADITLRKLFSSVYEINEISVKKPQVTIIKTGKHFNYEDLTKRFSGEDTVSVKKNGKPLMYYINNLHIDSATATYINSSPYNKIQIIHANLKIPSLAWNGTTKEVYLNFGLATGGEITSKSVVNLQTLEYKTSLNIQKVNIEPWYNYLKDYMKVNSLKGLLSTQLRIYGNGNKPTDIAAAGTLAAEKFSIVDNANDLLTSIERMDIQIDTINTSKSLYVLQTVSLKQPFIKVAMYDNGYNFSRLMTSPTVAGTDTSSISYSNPFSLMAGYLNDIVKDYVVNSYSANKIVIENGRFIFIDYTLPDKFQYNFDEMNILSDRVSSNGTKIYFEVNSHLNHSGRIKGNMSINPKDFKDFAIDASLNNLLASDFNPYSKYYVATPFLNGIISFSNKTNVTGANHLLKSDNDLAVQKIIAGKKDKTIKPQYNMPVRLAVSLLRDVHGDIKLKIPVSGSLDDPKFKFGKIIWQILGNVITKAATAPFRLLANAFGGKEEDYKEINFTYLQGEILPAQQEQLNSLIKVLKEKPDLKLELLQVSNMEDEIEIIALQQAKKKYLGIDSIDQITQKRIDSVSNKDSLFNHYLDAIVHSNSQSFLSTSEKCVQLIGKENLQMLASKYMQLRNQAVADYLMQQQIPAQRFLIHNENQKVATSQHTSPKYTINVAAEESTSTKETASSQNP